MEITVDMMKEYFLEMLKEGEKIPRMYSGKDIDLEMLKYATTSARNFISKHYNHKVI